MSENTRGMTVEDRLREMDIDDREMHAVDDLLVRDVPFGRLIVLTDNETTALDKAPHMDDGTVVGRDIRRELGQI